MTQKIYIVEGRQFRTQDDYNRAMHDKEIIEKLRARIQNCSLEQLTRLKQELENGDKRFYTILGKDFLDEIDESIEKKKKEFEKAHRRVKKQKAPKITREKKKSPKKKQKPEKKKTEKQKPKQQRASAQKQKKVELSDAELKTFIEDELKKRERNRKRFALICSLGAILCLGYVFLYTYYDYKTQSSYENLSALKEKPVSEAVDKAVENAVTVTLDGEKEAPDVLDEYKNLLNQNKKLIGWVKIADTNIDYPVMQTSDNEYYLDHNLNQEYDKNGSIFMDKECDVIKPSTNFILYGHHMKNGKMFGNLHLYSEASYYEKHPYIEFDTIYEKGTYQIMYAFRSRVYSEGEIVFKYYQFIDAYSEQEFDSYMQEMAALSYYDTGVTAEFGDQLLTLSTCDYQEKNGRFVVVAKKIK